MTEVISKGLYISAANRTGYKNVYLKPSTVSKLPYMAEDDDNYTLGRFATPEEAAQAYANWRAGTDLRVAEGLTIFESNGKPEKDLRYLVQRPAPSPREPVWVPVRKLPLALIEEWEAAQLKARNFALEPALASSSPSSLAQTGVELCRVDAADAQACADFLRSKWSDGELTLEASRFKVHGYASYGKTLAEHDEEQQRTHTLLFTHPQLPLCREGIPGFKRIDRKSVV